MPENEQEMSLPLQSRTLPSWALLGAILLAFGAGVGIAGLFFSQAPDRDINPDCIAHYPLIRPDLDCHSADEDYLRVQQIQESVRMYIEEEKAAGKITRASVFFRDLNSRRFAKINPQEKYISGSLLKLPLAIAYYKLAEIDPAILHQEFQYQPEAESLNAMETWKPAETLIPGKIYTAEEMIVHMIRYSDNETAVQLEHNIDPQFFKKVLADLGIILPETGGNTTDFLSVESYASMLRVLYLSSYLNIDHTQALLGHMSHSTFDVGLKATIPTETVVAHKFGEREIIDDATGKELSAQLHDCGIIYKTGHPYVLCVMTEGKSHDALPSVIAEISRMVFELE